MRNYGRVAVSEFLGDRIVYRNLTPCDPRLPSLEAMRPVVGLPAGRIPRKNEEDYARVIVHLLGEARRLEAPGASLRRLLYLGDTRMSDGSAFANICRAAGWPGLAFIGSEDNEPLSVEIVPSGAGGSLYLANRWSALPEFAGYCQEQGFPADENTAVVVDLDKTALGARGRNAHTIDQARVQAVRDTVADLLGPAFDQPRFQAAYSRLDQPAFHSFTADNQDYLAYICLAIGSGLYELEPLIDEVQNGRLRSFEQFIGQIDGLRAELPAALQPIHDEIYANVQAGDPTPFKPFRRKEYLATTGRMGFMGDDTAVETLLAHEIAITQEVRRLALDWLAQGALLFGLSDKPDEASLPTPELAAQGYVPLHRKETHAIGV